MIAAADLSELDDCAKYVDLWCLLHEWEELKKINPAFNQRPNELLNVE